MTSKNIKFMDPFEVPEHLIPPGMIYQWVSKKSHGQIDPQYQTMLNSVSFRLCAFQGAGGWAGYSI